MIRSPGEVTSVLDARAFAYDILTCVFLQEPTAIVVRLLVEGGVIHAFPFASGSDAMARALDALRACVERADVLSERHCERLQWDYTRMFVGPGRPPAPPWESIYRGGEHWHFSATTLAVRATYRRYGLAHGDVGREPDDHLGLELDFVHALCVLAGKKALEADVAGLAAILEDQRRFLDDHLLTWVPAWTRDMAKHADTDFYRGMAGLLEAFLSFDRGLVDEIIGTLPTAASRRGPHNGLLAAEGRQPCGGRRASSC